MRAWPFGGGDGGTSCGIQVTPARLRAVACDGAGRPVASGEVQLPDADSLAAAFAALRAAVPALGRRAVCCGPPGWTDAFPLRLPASGALEDLLVERARAHLSYALEEAVLDYLEPEPRADGSRRALLYALPRARVLELLGAARAGRFEIESIETAGTALHRLLRHRRALDARRSLVLDLDRDHALFLVADAEHLVLERSLAWGAGRLEQELATRLDMPAAAAGRLLCDPRTAGDAAGLDPVRAAVREILGPALEELGNEVDRMLAYGRAEFRDAPPERVLLAGATSAAWPLCEALAARIGDVDSVPPEEIEGQRGFAVAWGLALGALEARCGA